jgi:hypothetical protein
MRYEEKDTRRCIPVRLRDVPAEKRLSAAQRLCRTATDETEKAELLYAALFPSDRVYWIAA